MNTSNHVKLWEQIKVRLDACLPDWQQTIDRFGQVKAIEDRNHGKRWSDNEILEGLVRAVLSTNTDWSKIERILPELNLLFHDFSLQHYAQLDGGDIENRFIPWFRERRAGSMTLRKDLTNLTKAARKLYEWSKKHGCAEHYFTSLMAHLGNDPKKVALALGGRGSEYKLPALGVPIAAETLKNIGYDLAKPDRHVRRAVGSFGLVDFSKWPDKSKNKAPQAKDREMLKTMEAMENLAVSVTQHAAFLDNAVWLLCSQSGLNLSNQQLEALVT